MVEDVHIDSGPWQVPAQHLIDSGFVCSRESLEQSHRTLVPSLKCTCCLTLSCIWWQAQYRDHTEVRACLVCSGTQAFQAHQRLLIQSLCQILILAPAHVI